METLLYESGQKAIDFYKNELIDALRRVMFPEEITQTIADISKMLI